jgi:hypothetical protein
MENSCIPFSMDQTWMNFAFELQSAEIVEKEIK